MKKNNYNWSKVMGYVIIYLSFFSMGIVAGMMIQQRIIFIGLGEALSYSDIEVNVDINETLITDRVTENMKPILWDIRMDNCTKTEKGYCALECYENEKRTPCENFTGTEAFCDNGICRIDGVCPTYYEQLRGKTLTDCIKEVEEQK
jgi:hypothetical protein